MLMIAMSSIFSFSVRSSWKSNWRKRRARTSTLLTAAAAPSRIEQRDQDEFLVRHASLNYLGAHTLQHRFYLRRIRSSALSHIFVAAAPTTQFVTRASFISAPMSFGRPEVWANTTAGCAPPQPRSATTVALPR